MVEVTNLLNEARHEMVVFDRPSKRTALRMIEALTTAQAEIDAKDQLLEKMGADFAQVQSDALRAHNEIEALRARVAELESIGSCDLCAGKCRSHPLGDSAAWEPEEGSRAWIAQEARAAVLEEAARVAEECAALCLPHEDEIHQLGVWLFDRLRDFRATLAGKQP